MLNVARSNRIKDLFSEALELDDAGRTDLFSRAAVEDPSMESELRDLIDAHLRARGFLCEPDGPSGRFDSWLLDSDGLPVGEALGDDLADIVLKQ